MTKQNFESPSGLVEIDMVYFKRKSFCVTGGANMGRLILITNDDGIDAGWHSPAGRDSKSIRRSVGRRTGEQRSGKSHSVTYLEPLYVRERPGYMDGVKAYECAAYRWTVCAWASICSVASLTLCFPASIAATIFPAIFSIPARRALRWRPLSGESTPSRFPRPTSIIIP